MGDNKRPRDEDNDEESNDAWQLKPFNKGDMKGQLLAESSFAVIFPKTIKQDVTQMWPQVVARLEPMGVNAILDAHACRLEVTTTARTWDPYSILKGRELIRLIARGMGINAAAKVLEDGFDCDIINIVGFTEKVSSFNKRRQRLLGPNGATQKAIELLTGCNIFMLGNTISVVGPYIGLDKVRKIVEEAMSNKTHPNIKELMARRELAKDPSMQHENWARHVPTYAKVKKLKPSKEKKEDGEEEEEEGAEEQQKKPKKTKKKAAYTPFPNAPTPRKIDLEMESGVYLLTAEQKEAQQKKEQQQQAEERSRIKQQKRAQSFVAPRERKNKKNKTKSGAAQQSTKATLDNIKKNMQNSKKTHEGPEGSDFILKTKKQKT